MPDRQNEQEQPYENEQRERQERERRERERRERERQEQQQEQEEQAQQERVNFDADDDILQNPEAEDAQAEYEVDVDADTARQLDIDGVNLEEEEAIIEDKLEPGHYLDGDEVAAIHNKYEKVIERAKNEAEKEAKEAKENGKDFDKDALEKKIKGLKDQRNKEIEELCKNAPKYGVLARDMMRRKQLKDNELQDRGRIPRPRKVYRKEKGQDKLTVTIYGQNRIGEINKILREHEKNAAKVKGDKARHQVSKAGQGARDFSNGDAEHMFKGSVSMSLHAALFLLNRLAQARNKTAQGILYLYALYKLNMDDVAALQKALDDTAKTRLGKSGEKEDYADQEEVAGLPSHAHGGSAPANGSKAPSMEEIFEEPFECMGYTCAYAADYDVMAVQSFVDFEDGLSMDSFFCGREENLRKFFSEMGVPDVEQALVRNAEVARIFGFEKFMEVDNVKEAFLAAEKASKSDAGKDSSLLTGPERKGLPGPGDEYRGEKNPPPGGGEDGKNPPNPPSGGDGVGQVLPPGDEDAMDILDPKHSEGTEDKQDFDDAYALLNANDGGIPFWNTEVGSPESKDSGLDLDDVDVDFDF